MPPFAATAIWRVFAGLDKPKRTVLKVNLINIDAGKHVSAIFLN